MTPINRPRTGRALYFSIGLSLTLNGVSAAQTASNSSVKPAWPDNGIAQRMLPGAYNMFVEQDDHDQWHAWIMNGIGKDAQAIDFFTGRQIHVEATLDDVNGQQSRAFTDAHGAVHGPQSDRFEFTQGGLGGLSGGIKFADELLSLHGTTCNAAFTSVKGGVDEKNDPDGDHPKWTKISIYQDSAGLHSCLSGRLDGSIKTVLDLEDGTFLATEGCWVFRLRKSDLSPVGSAPGLRVVDEANVQSAIDQAKGKSIQNASDYLAKALNLSFDAANTCKSK
jgi:hypothetical protein